MITYLHKGTSVGFLREFHVEILRGGMNRLLLRSPPMESSPFRVEVHFQFVQALYLPSMTFSGLHVADCTDDTSALFTDKLVQFPELRIFKVECNSPNSGWIVAAGCAYDEALVSAEAPSNFPFMTHN